MTQTHPAALADCIGCERPVDAELAICGPCLTIAQQIIIDTADAYALIPDTAREIIGLRAIRYDKPPAGNPDPGDLPFGLNVKYDDPEDTRISAIRQPETALDILQSWADAWADQRGIPVDGSVFTYLVSSTRWAAQHADDSRWHDYLDEARRVRNVIRRLAGLNAERQAAPCPHCGGDVVQEWTAAGLDDALHCTRCPATWATLGRFVITTTDTLTAVPHTHPDLLVTTDEARLLLPDLKRNTLNVWLKRDRERPDGKSPNLPMRGASSDGHPLYRLSDITGLHQTSSSASTTVVSATSARIPT